MIQDLIKKYEKRLEILQAEYDSYDADDNALCQIAREEGVIQGFLKDLRELEGKISEKEIDAAALEYAQKASSAPDKETPEWVCTDFKAGVNWVKHVFENSNPLQR